MLVTAPEPRWNPRGLGAAPGSTEVERVAAGKEVRHLTEVAVPLKQRDRRFCQRAGFPSVNRCRPCPSAWANVLGDEPQDELPRRIAWPGGAADDARMI